MKHPHRIPEWLPQAAWFVASVFATGAFWYYLSQKDIRATVASAIGAILFAIAAIVLHRRRDASDPARPHRERIASFLVEAQALQRRVDQGPLPIAEHNAWVERVTQFLRASLEGSYAVRFGDFTGMTFFGDATERSKIKHSLEGRSRRLHEFLAELSPPKS